MPATPPPRTWAEISLPALRHNAGVARAHLAPGTQLMAVVKANAYGHGLAHAVEALRGSVEMFGVANVAEALEVRALAPEARVFILGPALPEERAVIAEHGFIASLSSGEEARAFSTLGRPVEAHFIVDTGMGRIGCWQEEAERTAREIAGLPGLRITGVASHLPVADEDAPWTREQLARFHTLAGRLRQVFPGALRHVENSAGVLGFAAEAGELVRPGLLLYGCSPLPEYQALLRPALTWKARVTLVREVGPDRGVSYGRTYLTRGAMRLATLGVGYADGFPRHLSGRGAEVLIAGRRCAVLGRVTMDQIVVDVTHLPEVPAGAEAVLLGRQGEEEIPVAEMAEKAGTIPWEIFTGLGARVVRICA